MKVLITGSSKSVGKLLFNSLKKNFEVFGISRNSSKTTTNEADITDFNKINKILDDIKPDVIVHCAALTAVDYCETHQDEARKINVFATENLVNWASKNDKKFIFMSSDYVYAGKENYYDENSKTEPVNFYGQTKLEAEKIVQKVKNHVILRPTVIFSYDPEGLNFLMQMLNLKEKRKIPIDQISNPTDAKILVDYIKLIIDKDIKGTFVATGKESINRYDFSLLIADVFGLDKSLLSAVKTSEFNPPAIRPLNNGTNSEKIRKLLNYKSPNLRESLERIKIEIKKNN